MGGPVRTVSGGHGFTSHSAFSRRLRRKSGTRNRASLRRWRVLLSFWSRRWDLNPRPA